MNAPAEWLSLQEQPPLMFKHVETTSHCPPPEELTEAQEQFPGYRCTGLTIDYDSRTKSYSVTYEFVRELEELP